MSPQICSWGYHHYILHHLWISNNIDRGQLFYSRGQPPSVPPPLIAIWSSLPKFILEDILYKYYRVTVWTIFLIHEDSPRLQVQFVIHNILNILAINYRQIFIKNWPTQIFKINEMYSRVLSLGPILAWGVPIPTSRTFAKGAVIRTHAKARKRFYTPSSSPIIFDWIKPKA